MTPRRLLAGLLGALMPLPLACSAEETPAAPPSASADPADDGPIVLGSPVLPAAQQRACGQLLAAVSTGLADREPRTDVAPGLGTAYGDPALVLRCGVGIPDGFDPTVVPDPRNPAPCTIVSGVGWYVPVEEARGGVPATFTTIGYRPRISVTVPTAAQPEGGAAALAQLAPAVKATLERRALDPTQRGGRVSPCA